MLGTITTVAGNGAQGFSGDGRPATQAHLASPRGVFVDSVGTLYIADGGNNRIRKVDASGLITTVVGSDDTTSLNFPSDVFVDRMGNLFIADLIHQLIRKVDTSGIITTVAGNGNFGFSGDGGPAINASLQSPTSVFVDDAGNLFIADFGNNRIRKVDASGLITTVAGNGIWGFSGDGGPAIDASLAWPSDVFVDGAGNLFIADGRNNRIRKVDTSGLITTVAGNGTEGFSGDGGPATQASLAGPLSVFVDGAGNLFIADGGNRRIRKVDASGFITTVAGNGTQGFSGDGGLAINASLGPVSVSGDGAGNLYIADQTNHRIRRLESVAANGDTTLAGPRISFFSVNSTSDFEGDRIPGDGICASLFGDCTLRAAFQEANAWAGVDTIRFDIALQDSHTIVLLAPLPTITDPVVIDGTSEPDYTGVPIVELNGALISADGLHITAGNSVVRGLVINRFSGAGIHLEGGGNNVIQGNYIGTDTSGTVALVNASGVFVVDSPGNTIGGLSPAERNVITSRVDGIVIVGSGSSGNTVQGNYLGTDHTGTEVLGNRIGLVINASGTTVGPDNVIAASDSSGIVIGGFSGNVVQGNYIGTAASGTNALGNRAEGIVIAFSDSNLVGGLSFLGQGNVIAGNGSHGVHLFEAGSSAVQGNYIGTDSSGTVDLGNGGDGVRLSLSSSANTIGGLTPLMGNTIAFNRGHGVGVEAGRDNAVLSNAIYANAGLGIDLGLDGVTVNDADTAGTGPNRRQNFPVLDPPIAGLSTVSGTLDSDLQTTYRIELFAGEVCDPSDHGEGQAVLDSVHATTDSTGRAAFVVHLSDLLSTGRFLTATATDPTGNTSEFSACVAVAAPDTAVGTRPDSITSVFKIHSVADVSNDQGRYVRITWNKHLNDAFDAAPSITSYSVWRKIDPDLPAVRAKAVPDSTGTPAGRWDFITTVPAHQSDTYSVVVPTLADSTAAGGIYYSTFFVQSQTAAPSIHYSTVPDSGYSVDNLEPHTPTHFALTTSGSRAKLVWDPVPDEDLAYYAIYRGASPEVEPAAIYQATIDTVFEDPIDEANRFYRIAAFDFAGNQSSLSEVLEAAEVFVLKEDFDGDSTVGSSDFFAFANVFGRTVPPADPKFDLDGDGTIGFNDFFLFADAFGQTARAKLMALAREYIDLPSAYRLGQNYPNPFNSSTMIRYRIAEAGWVQLDIFDLSGQRIKALAREMQGPGFYEITWDGTNEQGRTVSSGIYLMRLQSHDFTEVRKMMLMK